MYVLPMYPRVISWSNELHYPVGIKESGTDKIGGDATGGREEKTDPGEKFPFNDAV
jgi:hypothetical protein